ncbi:MAG: hypothetical protein IPN68_04015 [Bacteroidetes bacterium]|nr:hypothetical protein [Bacteroidota bacterium]
MSRYIIIVLLAFLFSGLSAQKQDSLKVPVKSVLKQDTLKAVSNSIPPVAANAAKKIIQVPDSVRFSSKVPPASAFVYKLVIVSKKQGFIKADLKHDRKLDTATVFVKLIRGPGPKSKPRVILPPDYIRFDSKKPPEKVKPVPVNIVCKKQGFVKAAKPGLQKHDSVRVYIKVLRKQDANGFLTTVAPNELPVRENKLVPLKYDLIVPPWLIARRKAELEAKKRAEQAKLDSAKAPKPRIIRQWNLSSDHSAEVPVLFDTLFSLYNRYRITDIYSPVNAYLGNYGLPYYSINFFDRIYDPDKFLYFNHYHFMHNLENALFMNLQVPFTELKWMLSGEKKMAEQTFRITHSQNINRKLNFGMIYDIIFSLGQYSNQRSDNKTFTFYTSYTGSIYKLYLSAGINGLSGQENGGITSKDELDIDITNTLDIPVKMGTLNDASSLIKNRNILVVQKFTFIGAKPDNDTVPKKWIDPVPLTGTFSHILQFDYSRRTYSDNSPGSGFYDSIYINKSATFDSLSSKFVKNTFRFDFTTDTMQDISFSAGFGLRNENFWFGQIIPGQDSVVSDTANWFRGNNVFVGRFENHIGNKFHWLATGEFFFDRYRQGDFIFNGLASRSFNLKKGKIEWQVTGELNKRTPSFWYTQWGGNHFKWNLDPEKESRLELGTRVIYPARNMDIKFKYAVINNYLDFDTLALPSQDTSSLNVMALSFRKDFKLWKFHFVPDVTAQKSSNMDILDLPLATIRAAAYIEHVFNFEKTNGRLYTQLGVDVIYHTLYHPYTYMPATGRFYRQTQYETGGYPFVNVFLNLKLKRTRFFLMFDHLNYAMMNPEMLYNYEMVPLYPMTTRRFSFGLAWTFYN